MNIDELKDVLGDKFQSLKTYVQDLEATRDAARNESETGRAKFKKIADERDALRSATEKLCEKLGVESIDEIESLPDAKGQAEAVKQFEAKMKRLERELADERKVKDELSGKLRETSLTVKLEKALGAHEWLDRDTASLLLKNNVVYEGDDAFFKTSDGKMISLEEGAKALAQTKQFLLKSSGAGGSGYTGAGGAGGEKTKTVNRAEFDKMSHFDRATFAKEGGKVVD